MGIHNVLYGVYFAAPASICGILENEQQKAATTTTQNYMDTYLLPACWLLVMFLPCSLFSILEERKDSYIRTHTHSWHQRNKKNFTRIKEYRCEQMNANAGAKKRRKMIVRERGLSLFSIFHLFCFIFVGISRERGASVCILWHIFNWLLAYIYCLIVWRTAQLGRYISPSRSFIRASQQAVTWLTVNSRVEAATTATTTKKC